MTVEITRIHVAVAHRGESLHTKKERIEKGTGPHPRNAIAADSVKRSKEKIEGDVNSGDEGCKLRPTQTEQPLIGVARSPLLNIKLEEFELP